MTIRELIEMLEKLIEIAGLLIQIWWHRAVEWLLDLRVEDLIGAFVVLGLASGVFFIGWGVVWAIWEIAKHYLRREDPNEQDC